MGGFLSGVMGGLGEAMHEDRKQKTLMDFERQKMTGSFLLQLADSDLNTPDERNQYIQMAMQTLGGKPIKPDDFQNVILGHTQKVKQAQAQAQEAQRRLAIINMGAPVAPQPPPMTPTDENAPISAALNVEVAPQPVQGLGPGGFMPAPPTPAQERQAGVTPTVDRPINLNAGPTPGPPPPGVAPQPVEQVDPLAGILQAPGPEATFRERKAYEDIKKAVTIAQLQGAIKSQAETDQLRRKLKVLTGSGLLQDIDAINILNFIEGKPLTRPKFPPNPPKPAVLHSPQAYETLDGQKFVGSFNPDNQTVVSGTAVYPLSMLKPIGKAERNPNQYADFKEDYMKRHPQASAGEVLREYEKVIRRPPSPPMALMLIPTEGGGYKATTVSSGQTVAPGAVTPTGASSMNVPTAATRGMAEKAPRVLHFVNRINDLIDANEKQLGPLASRWSEFTAGKVGVPNRGYIQLRTDLGLLHTALMNMHVGARGGERIMQHFADMINGAQQSPENLRAALDEIKAYSQEVAKEGVNKGVAGPEKAAQGGYRIGGVYQGMEYLGGSPGDQANWRKK